MENVRQTVISQYATAPSMLSLIDSINDHIDPATDFDAFYRFIWDLETAEGVGLDIWGRIVGVGRVLAIPGTAPYFGFEDGFTPFDEGPFWNEVPITGNYTLADDAYRMLIFVKAAANISATTIPVLNRLLREVFKDRGRCFVVNTGGMTMQYRFEFYLAPYEMSILQNSGALPAPAGVEVSIVQVPLASTFGFAEAGAGLLPFDEGTFYRKGQ